MYSTCLSFKDIIDSNFFAVDKGVLFDKELSSKITVGLLGICCVYEFATNVDDIIRFSKETHLAI
jgi:hypothetical protein